MGIDERPTPGRQHNVQTPVTLTRRAVLQHAGRLVGVVASAAALGTLGSAGDAWNTAEAARRGAAGPVPWHVLAGSITGRLVLPRDPAYSVDRLIYNERFDGVRPSAIAYCETPSDVQRCVEFARRHHVHVAARSGGHSYGGYSLSEGLVVDVTPMSSVGVRSGGRQAVVGSGARMIDVYEALGSHGRLLPGSSCPTVGIAGLTLGGGVSVFSRRYGLTCDQLAAVRLVTADGRLLTCDRRRHEELFWACQGGGGGNFGIVTSFTFDLHPIPPVALFTLVWPWDAASDVLGAWLEWLPRSPDALWSNCQLLSSGAAGGASPLAVRVTGVFCGTAPALAGVLDPLRAAVGAPPGYSFIGPESYLPAMLIEAGCEGMSVTACHLPSQNPAGTLSRTAFMAKSAYVTAALPDGGLRAVVDSVASLDQAVPGVGGGIVFDSYGGAVNRVPRDATAFVHRDALAGLQWSFSWSASPSANPAIGSGTAWLGQTAQRLGPYVTGAYQNYIDPSLADWQEAYYGTNLARLVKVKRDVDPDDFFHFAQSIPTHLRGKAVGPSG